MEFTQDASADASVILCTEELLLVSQDPRWEGGSEQPDLGRPNALVSEDIPNPLPSKVWEAAEGHSAGVCEAYLNLVCCSPSEGLGNFPLFENIPCGGRLALLLMYCCFRRKFSCHPF